MSAITESIARLSAQKDVVYPNLDAIKKDGFTSIGAGLLLRSASETETEVWSMEARDDGQIQLLQAPQYGYAPILLPRDVERKVVASADDAVETPYGNGRQVGLTKDGSPIVEVMSRRYVMAKDQVRRAASKVETSVQLVAKDPAHTPVTAYIVQAAEEGRLDEKAYFAEAYGDAAYASQLTKSMGQTSEHKPKEGKK
jgi:hypothetical protein